MRDYRTAICRGCQTQLHYQADLDLWLHEELPIAEAWTHKADPDPTTINGDVEALADKYDWALLQPFDQVEES